VSELQNILDLLILLVTGAVTGVSSELLSKRKPNWLYGLAFLIGLVGALIAVAVFGDLLHAAGPYLDDVPIIPCLLGAIVLLLPWFWVRSGKTKYGRERSWRTKYWRA
jgi:uncharacterized membrane protein YeaQ/YmgE (transglycosylase-associated protein family)